MPSSSYIFIRSLNSGCPKELFRNSSVTGLLNTLIEDLRHDSFS